MIASRAAPGRRSCAAASGADGWLGLAAAPAFAVMAVLTGVPGGGAEMICSAAHNVSPLSGMAPMYALMSAFHLTPWVTAIARRRSAAHRSSQVSLDQSR